MKKLIILTLILFLTGCWNYRELNNMAIIGSVGIDYDYEDKSFIVSVQVFNAKKSTGAEGSAADKSPVTFYQNKAKTVHEAFRNVVSESPKKLYIGHMDLVVLGEKLVEEHFMDAMDFLFRDAESRKTFNIFVSKGIPASSVLKVLTPLETIPSASLYQTLLVNGDYRATATAVKFDEAMSSAYGKGIEIVLPAVEIIGDLSIGEKEENVNEITQKVILSVNSNAIFKDKKFIGYLTPEESLGYNFIVGRVKQNVVSFPCDDEGNYASIEIVKTNSKLKVDIKDGELKGIVNIKGTSNLSEINCKIPLSEPQNQIKMQELSNKMIEEIAKKTFLTAKDKFDSDIFGFGKSVYRNDYKYWTEINGNWYEHYSNMKIEIKSDITILNKGSITTSTKEGEDVSEQ